jgi:hypothetical protein
MSNGRPGSEIHGVAWNNGGYEECLDTVDVSDMLALVGSTSPIIDVSTLRVLIGEKSYSGILMGVPARNVSLLCMVILPNGSEFC